MVIQPDGKIIGGGYAYISLDGVGAGPAFALTRYNPNGSLDTTFGSAGKLTTYFNGNEQVDAIVLQQDGKIVAGGFADLGGGNFAFALARYNTNGTLDTTFDGDGKFVRDITNGLDHVLGLAIRPDGKIIATGHANAGTATDFATLRLNVDGSIDTSFGTAGLVLTDFGGVDGGAEIALFADGKFVVAGSAFESDGGGGDFALVGYNADGSLDLSFGTGGKVRTDFGGAVDNAADMAIAPDGKLVVAGYSGPAGAYDFAVARYNRNGSLDTTFDGDGKVRIDVTGSGRIDGANAVAVQRNGKIVVAGRAQLGSNSPFDLATARLNVGGGLDSSFGSGGKVFTDFAELLPNSFNATNDEFSDLVIQPDGKIVTAGDIEDMTRFEYDMALARLIGDPVTSQSRRTVADFNGDGRTDVSIFRPSDRSWHVLDSAGSYTVTQFGLSTDKLAPADYDGDGKTDIAVFRDGIWYWLNSSNGAFKAMQFGIAGDIPLPGDFDGDGRAELAVYRGGTWYTRNLTSDQSRADRFGLASDRPVPADFDGDGKTDYAVYRDGVWYTQRSSDGGFAAMQFGIASDQPVVGDYDGDAKADLAVYRSGTWYVLGTSAGFSAVPFGLATDIPTAGDYDGDGKTDLAVFRNGIWYEMRSQQNFWATQFGTANDRPVPAAYSSLGF